jgi:hypothetical protein
MESSETHEKVINLGNQLVALLGEGRDADILSRWMSHYIAEQIVAAENAKHGEEKASAEQRCFDTILKLWSHRAAMPSGRRPFESFDEIIRVLDYLDPSEQRGFYQQFRTEKKKPANGSVEQLTEFMVGIDRITRLLLQSVLTAAVEKASDDPSREMLRHALPVGLTSDLRFFKKLIPSPSEDVPKEAESEKLAELRERIEQLTQFEKLCRSFRKSFAAELSSLELPPSR